MPYRYDVCEQDTVMKLLNSTVIADLTSPEAKTFRQFVTEKKQPPASKTALRHYYNQQHPPALPTPGGTP